MGAIYISRGSTATSERMLQQQGFATAERLNVGTYCVQVYARQQDDRPLLQRFENDDFIATVRTEWAG